MKERALAVVSNYEGPDRLAHQNFNFMNNLSDVQQFELFREGRLEAFEYFFNNYHKKIRKDVLDMSGSEALAKEITQEAFKRAWDLRNGMNNVKDLRDYLDYISEELVIQHVRKERTAFNVAQDLAFLAQRQEGKDAEIGSNQVLAAMDDAMRKLSPMRRLVLYLLFIKGYETAAVARMLSISPQTVRNTKTQALAFLRAELYSRDLFMPLILVALLLYIDQG